MLQRPVDNEYPKYYVPYVKLVSDGDLLSILKENLAEMVALFEGLSEEDGHFRYATDKWSIKEVLGHMTDTERIMSYRLLRVGRGDQTPLAGFDENDYINGSQFDLLSNKEILEDFKAVRHATITLIQTMADDGWNRKGIANGTEITTRAIAYIIVGHAIHHGKIIKERYLTDLNK
ncbi:DinB family protein [Neobacillus sp. MM2021_6]|uniref:DinB family protein n=1 Tax=Bacillaceae TaxID=186817 RepID=UPI00140D4196|nr:MULTISPECIES: DinB family protein [Bacillaceae]MBO0959733.1 DinB family protein [Neobacillus sp. MM2021_6]NHC19187.1 DinB family protein [Bacillus sp. MM2020_4]